jgi:3-dehydroquinate dehydratase-2
MSKKLAKILVLHGPNLNLLGSREPEQYGKATLAEIDAKLGALGSEKGYTVVTFQSNAEAALIDRIQLARNENIGCILINPAGYTHTSVALRDALAAVSIPFIEVHLSNIHAREPFRSHSYFSDRALGVVSGFGPLSYVLALHAAMDYLDNSRKS